MSFFDETIGPEERPSEMRDAQIQLDKPGTEIGENLGLRRRWGRCFVPRRRRLVAIHGVFAPRLGMLRIVVIVWSIDRHMWERSTLVELSPRTGVCTAVQPPRDGQTHGRAKVGEGWRYGPTDTLIGHFLFEPLNVFFCWSGIFQTNDKNPAMFQQVYLPRSILCFERYVIRHFDYSSIYSSIQDKKLVFDQSDSMTLIRYKFMDRWPRNV
jgi:hypothetical protein